MVLSGSKRTSYMSSIVNQDSGGGPKKAGLPFQIGREASVSIAYRKTSSNYVFLQGPKAILKQKLMFANRALAKATAAKDAVGATQDDIDAYNAAVTAAATAATNLTNYTADV